MQENCSTTFVSYAANMHELKLFLENATNLIIHESKYANDVVHTLSAPTSNKLVKDVETDSFTPSGVR